MCGHPRLHLQISSLLFFLSFYSFCLSVFFYLLTHLLLASWGLGCREWVFSSHGEQGLLSNFRCMGFLLWWLLSLVAELGLWCEGAAVVAQGFAAPQHVGS